ncbi:hypothetical protein BDR26DRAFT_920211 [Obelidium mucronatum]|nr:hypothetical protein BDR26DRAFT_920211 [Obelidium mucronatum]
MGRFLPFVAGGIVSATAYSIFSSQIQHDERYSRQQLAQLSAKVLRAADASVPVERIPTDQGYLNKVLGSQNVFGTSSIRQQANNAAEYWNGGVRSVASFLIGGGN